MCLFFFSSRRRHTILTCDWSSDVCSSDLSGMPNGGILTVSVPGSVWGWQDVLTRFGTKTFKEVLQPAIDYAEQGFPISEERSEERRVGKECRARRAP